MLFNKERRRKLTDRVTGIRLIQVIYTRHEMESIRLVNILKMGRNKEKRKISSDQGTGWTIQGLIPRRGSSFSRLRMSRRLWGPPSLLLNGYWGVLSVELKRPGREFGHPPLSSAEFNNELISTFNQPVSLRGADWS